jgi:pyridoxine/pyridoxamine 5'-phosphate oxidase
MEESILSFLKNRFPKLCTIATISQANKPENAVVGYAVTDDLHIIINTNHKTRKWSNIQNNPSIALVFGWGFDELNIQYEGTAEQIELDHPKYHELENFFFTQNPDARKFKSPDTRIVYISPKWIRLMNPTQYPPSVEEKSF